jgi:hypothetical protein
MPEVVKPELAGGAAMAAALAALAAVGGELPMPVHLDPKMPFDVLSLSEAAGYLRLPEDAVRAEAEAGRLVGQHIRGEWRFVRFAVVAWLQTPQKPARVSETQNEYDALMASIRAQRDEIDRATGHGKYAEE